MSKSRPITHPLTNQLEYEYILGPIKIKDGLFIGDEFAAKDIEFIHTNKVTHIINTVSRKIPNIWEKVGVQYLSFNWGETDWNIFDKKNSVINAIFSFVEEAMDLGECCLIHSMNSKSRSFLVVAVYLMKKYSWSLDKIFSFVSSKKPGIEVKGVFMKQLKQMQEKMNKIHAFSSSWQDAKNQDDLILKNTYINSFPIQFSEVYKPGKNSNKKLTWQEVETKGNRFKDDRKKVYQSVKDMKKQQSREPKIVKSILKFSSNNWKQEGKQEEPTNIINNINGNIIHVTVNNFITPDDEPKTAMKQPPNPVMTRPYSSDTKDKNKKDSAMKEKINPYQSFFNFKSPYQSKQPGQKPKRPAFGSSKLGMNDTFKRSSDNFKQNYQRPLSAAHPDKKKLKPSTGTHNPLIKDMMITNTTKPFVGGRYPSPMVKDNTTATQLRDRWRRGI